MSQERVAEPTYAVAITELIAQTRRLLERIERELGPAEALPITGELARALAALRRADRSAR